MGNRDGKDSDGNAVEESIDKTKVHAGFKSGDERACENFILTVLHTIWHREHNRCAALLQNRDPSLNDEQIFRKAHRLMRGMFQSVVYNEFLPATLGYPKGTSDENHAASRIDPMDYE